MSDPIDFIYCKLPDTPRWFDKSKFKDGDASQKELYSKSKKPDMDSLLTYEQICDKTKKYNYARFVPKGCVYLDFDNKTEAEKILEIIRHSKLKCLVLKTVKGYHFLFRIPKFYKSQMTGATNWFGYKFDTKGVIDKEKAIQIIRVCGMDREERISWDWDAGPIEPPECINIEALDVLPYWLWGKLKDTDLHKSGKPGDSEYHLDDTPFTQLMKMKDGGRHDHIFSRCGMFALSNGFTKDEFKTLIQVIHDEYLVKIGTPMSDSDLFGDLETRWEDYDATLSSSGWDYDEKERKWKKVKKKKDDKIDERRAAEYLFTHLDCYVTGKNMDGTYTNVLHRDVEGDYNYRVNVPERRKLLRSFSEQNFKDAFFKEVEVQLMQMCIENGKFIKRTNEYVIAKNKVLICIQEPETRDFDYLKGKTPTDVVLPWNWYSEEWVEEHKEDLGGLITKFIKELSRDSSGKPQPEVEQWLWVIAGASMIPANELHKIVILSGGGSNGKSVYTSLIRFCLGDEMYNTAKIFDSSPYDGFWGATFDRGILCVVDDLIKNYNRDAFSYLKGPVTGSEPVEINEKFKPKKQLSILPQIIACTNHDFELYDKTEGMRRRVLILPTEFQIPLENRDELKQYKLVLNTEDEVAIASYRLKYSNGGDDEGTLIMKMRTREKGVLDSLDHGSLAWFANKARYEYFKAMKKKFILNSSERMKESFGATFSGGFDVEIQEFLDWYVIERKESIWTKELYLEYQDWHNEMATGEMMMTEKGFSMRLGKAVGVLLDKGYKIEMKKVRNDKGMSLNRLCINGKE